MSVTIRTAGCGGQIHSFCAMNSLSMSFWIVPPTRSQGTPWRSALTRYIASRIDAEQLIGHRGGDLVDRDAIEQAGHIVNRGDRDAFAAHLAFGPFVVGVVTHQGGHVEGGGQPVLSLAQEKMEAGVGLLGQSEAGELAHRPQPSAIHRAVNAARVGILAGVADIALEIAGYIVGSVSRLQSPCPTPWRNVPDAPAAPL